THSQGAVTTVAGAATSPSGATDGVGTNTRFRAPGGIWGDVNNLYVCDTLNFTIRKIVVATQQVTTVAGYAQARGNTDGAGSAARFYAPTDVWGDGVYLYVADGNAIRKITIATGLVRTFAGSVYDSGYVNGTAGVARF